MNGGLTYSVSRGFSIRIAARWQPPDGASSMEPADYDGGLVVRNRRTGADVIAPDDAVVYDEEVCGFAATLAPAFTERFEGGSYPYVISASSQTEKFEVQSGYLVVRDIGGMSQNERTLCGLRDLMEARASGGDVELMSLSMPGGMNYAKMSGAELAKLVTYYEAKVAHEKYGFDRGYLRW